MRIAPDAQRVLDDIAAASGNAQPPEDATARLTRARRDTDSLVRFSASAPADVRRTDLDAPARDGRRIPVRLYREAGETGRKLLVWFHGGGAIAGSLDTHEPILMELARRTGRVVASVGYRLAPETTYPGQHEDCLDAARWLAREAQALGFDAADWAVGGDSVGGLYATVVARLLFEEDFEPAPGKQVLLYPNTDMRQDRDCPSLDENEGRVMTRASLRYEADNAVPDPASREEPMASPLLAPDLSGSAPVFLSTCEADPLRDEGDAYGRRLAEAGVPLTHRRYPGMIHAFFQMTGRIPAAIELMDEIGAFLRRA